MMVAAQYADIDALKRKQKNYQNINFLRITGLTCENKDVNTCFLHLAQEIGVESITQSDFSARKLAPRQKQSQQPNSSKKQGQGHDLTSDPATPNQNKTTRTNTWTVIVEFYNNGWESKCMQLRQISKGQGLFISEQLSQKTSALFFQCRQLKKTNKIKAACTHELKITIKTNQGTNIKITTEADLKQFQTPEALITLERVQSDNHDSTTRVFAGAISPS